MTPILKLFSACIPWKTPDVADNEDEHRPLSPQPTASSQQISIRRQSSSIEWQIRQSLTEAENVGRQSEDTEKQRAFKVINRVYHAGALATKNVNGSHLDQLLKTWRYCRVE